MSGLAWSVSVRMRGCFADACQPLAGLILRVCHHQQTSSSSHHQQTSSSSPGTCCLQLSTCRGKARTLIHGHTKQHCYVARHSARRRQQTPAALHTLWAQLHALGTRWPHAQGTSPEHGLGKPWLLKRALGYKEGESECRAAIQGAAVRTAWLRCVQNAKIQNAGVQQALRPAAGQAPHSRRGQAVHSCRAARASGRDGSERGCAAPCTASLTRSHAASGRRAAALDQP